MKSSLARFASAFFITLLIFAVLNVLAAHLQSDCGIGAWLGTAGCADDIKRAGFPLLFAEEGGFAFHTSFDSGALVADLVIAFVVSIVVGLIAGRRTRPMLKAR